MDVNVEGEGKCYFNVKYFEIGSSLEVYEEGSNRSTKAVMGSNSTIRSFCREITTFVAVSRGPTIP